MPHAVGLHVRRTAPRRAARLWSFADYLEADPSHRVALVQLLGAVAVELSTADLGELETAAAKVEVQGARYPEELQKMVGR